MSAHVQRLTQVLYCAACFPKVRLAGFIVDGNSLCLHHARQVAPVENAAPAELPIHRTEAGYPRCATCDGGGCLDCTDPA